MAIGVQGLSQWQNWRSPVTADDGNLITQFRPTDVWAGGAAHTWTANQSGRFVSSHPFTAIAIIFLGLGTENETAVVEISGWMQMDSKNGPGPGLQLWKGTLLLSATAWTTDIPHPSWATGVYRCVDDFTSTYDNANVTLIEDTGAVTGMMLLPTLGFHSLHMQFTDVGTGGEATSMGALWRGVSKEGVL